MCLLGLKETFQAVVFSRTLASAGKELQDNFLKALAEREEANRTGKMTVSTLLQHSNCYVMGFPSNMSAVPLGWEQNPYCVRLNENTPCTSTNTSCLPHSLYNPAPSTNILFASECKHNIDCHITS